MAFGYKNHWWPLLDEVGELADGPSFGMNIGTRRRGNNVKDSNIREAPGLTNIHVISGLSGLRTDNLGVREQVFLL